MCGGLGFFYVVFFSLYFIIIIILFIYLFNFFEGVVVFGGCWFFYKLFAFCIGVFVERMIYA